MTLAAGKYSTASPNAKRSCENCFKTSQVRIPGIGFSKALFEGKKVSGTFSMHGTVPIHKANNAPNVLYLRLRERGRGRRAGTYGDGWFCGTKEPER